MAKKDEVKQETIAPKIIKDVEELSCDLNQVEWDNRARELAESQRNFEQMEERKKSTMAEINADLKIARAKTNKLATIVATRAERREVTVEIKFDYEEGTVTKRRTDTGEIINQREMTTNERQAEIEFTRDANDFVEYRDKGDADELEAEADGAKPSEEENDKE